MFEIIWSYLSINCYKETAYSLLSQWNINDKKSNVFLKDPCWTSIDDRKNLMEMIKAGEITDAIEFCKSKFPSVLSEEIQFKLESQYFIELVRLGASNEALSFAQSVLSQYAKASSSYLEQIQDMFAIIAYESPIDSPVGKYLELERRNELAYFLNSQIIEVLNGKFETKLERLVQHHQLLQQLMIEHKIQIKE